MPEQTEIATRERWKKLKNMSTPHHIPFQGEYLEQEIARIKQGLIPQAMEDKWLMFFENGKLFVHRSWSGICIYEVTMEEKETKWIATSTLVNRNKEEYNHTDDEYDVKLLGYLIDQHLLGKPVDFPIPKKVGTDKSGIYQHHIDGTGRRPTSNDKSPWWKFW